MQEINARVAYTIPVASAGLVTEFDTQQIIEKFQNQINKAMELVMRQTNEIMDDKLESMNGDIEEQMSNQNLNIDAKINELKSEMLHRALQQENNVKQAMEKMSNHYK